MSSPIQPHITFFASRPNRRRRRPTRSPLKEKQVCCNPYYRGISDRWHCGRAGRDRRHVECIYKGRTAGWAAIVPIYNLVVLLRTVGRPAVVADPVLDSSSKHRDGDRGLPGPGENFRQGIRVWGGLVAAQLYLLPYLGLRTCPLLGVVGDRLGNQGMSWRKLAQTLNLPMSTVIDACRGCSENPPVQ
jgi:hypothetical protein